MDHCYIFCSVVYLHYPKCFQIVQTNKIGGMRGIIR